MMSADYKSDLARVFLRIASQDRPMTLYLSQAGHPTWIPGVGCRLVGVYTQQVSIKQVMDDIRESEIERRRGVG